MIFLEFWKDNKMDYAFLNFNTWFSVYNNYSFQIIYLGSSKIYWRICWYIFNINIPTNVCLFCKKNGKKVLIRFRK